MLHLQMYLKSKTYSRLIAFDFGLAGRAEEVAFCLHPSQNGLVELLCRAVQGVVKSPARSIVCGTIGTNGRQGLRADI